MVCFLDNNVVKCQHCSYVWDYKGQSKFYCTCPRCLYKVKVKVLVKPVVPLSNGNAPSIDEPVGHWNENPY